MSLTCAMLQAAYRRSDSSDAGHYPSSFDNVDEERRGHRDDEQVCRCDTVAISISKNYPRVGPGCVLCTRIDRLRFLAGCHRRQLNQGLVVALGFISLLDRACFCVIFFGLWVHVVFSSLYFCYQYQCNWLPGKIRPRNDFYVLSGTLNLTKLKLIKNYIQKLGNGMWRKICGCCSLTCELPLITYMKIYIAPKS